MTSQKQNGPRPAEAQEAERQQYITANLRELCLEMGAWHKVKRIVQGSKLHILISQYPLHGLDHHLMPAIAFVDIQNAAVNFIIRRGIGTVRTDHK